MAKHKHKRPVVGFELSSGKEPRIAHDPDAFHQRKPAWRLSRLALSHPFGWHEIASSTLLEIRLKLANFESMTWGEILVDGKKQNHHIPIADLCQGARTEAARLRLDVDELCVLHLNGTQRVWGILADGVFHLLWWDPHHDVCPSKKRHT